jgi:hypothetical protein
MSDTRGFGVHYPTLETVRQRLLDGHASLTQTVQGTQDGCTAAANAYPAWSTSAVVARLHAAHAQKVSDHAAQLTDYSIRTHLSSDNYRSADNASERSANAIGREV